MFTNQQFNWLLKPEELSQRVLEELLYVSDILRNRTGKIIDGNEYLLLPSKEGWYRGDLMGSLVAAIYTHNSSVLWTPWGGIDIFVDGNYRGALSYTNNRAFSDEVTREFEEYHAKRGFNIPSGGAFL